MKKVEIEEKEIFGIKGGLILKTKHGKLTDGEYHIGIGITNTIYVGKFEEPNDGVHFKWKLNTRHELKTTEVLMTAAQYLIDNDQQMNFDYNGKRYCLNVIPEPEEERA